MLPGLVFAPGEILLGATNGILLGANQSEVHDCNMNLTGFGKQLLSECSLRLSCSSVPASDDNVRVSTEIGIPVSLLRCERFCYHE